MQNYLYVEIDEEITSVIGKLRQFDKGQVFLVVPKGALVAGSLVNLKLLEKEAKKLKNNLVFVSPDAHVRKLAEKAGLEIKRYVAKPDTQDHVIKPAEPLQVEIPIENRKLSGWEEEAAKQELNQIMGIKEAPAEKDVAVVPPIPPKVLPPLPTSGDLSLTNGPVDLRNIKKPVKLSVGTFHKPFQKSTKPLVRKPNEDENFVGGDLKKENNFNQREQNDGLKAPNLDMEVKEKIDQKDKYDSFQSKQKEVPSFKTIPLENVEEVKNDGNMDISSGNIDINLKEPRKKPKFSPSPFRTKKLKSGPLLKTLPHDLKLSEIENFENVNHLDKFKKNGLKLETEVAKEENDYKKESENEKEERMNKIQFFDKEMANLTLKEKEQLKDLWMEQSGSIRSRSIKARGGIDLKFNKEKVVPRAEILKEEGLLLRTTHQKVGGEGRKVLDLRNSFQSIPSSSNETNQITRDFPETKKKKLIILPVFNIKLFFIFAFGILFILILIAGIIIPSVDVKIKARNLTTDLDVKATVSGEISGTDMEKRMIVGKPIHFKIREEEDFSVASETQVAGKTKGQIIVYNKYSEPLSLKAGALIKSTDGKKFLTIDQVLVPAAKTKTSLDNVNSNSNDNSNENSNINANNNSATTVTEPGNAVVNVEAEAGGEENGVKKGSFSFPGLVGTEYDGLVTGEVKKEITGGETLNVKTVTKEELDKAQETLLQKAKDDSGAELNKNLDLNQDIPKNFKTLPVQVEGQSFSSDKSQDAQAETFKGTLEVSFFTLAFNEEDFVNLTKTLLKQDDLNKGKVEILSYEVSGSAPLENKMDVNAKTNYSILSELNLEEIKKEIIGKKKQEAIDFLTGNRQIESFSLDLWPSFMPNMPIIKSRIKVEKE